MSGLLWRVLLAIVCVVIAAALVSPVARILGFPLSSDFALVIRICIAGLAVLYILRGKSAPPA
jgi:phosphate/sulfate permease